MNREENWLLTEKYGGEKTADFFIDCKRLAGGEPLAYLIGHVPFLSTKIYLDSHPLIPRPETEFWVEKVIQNIGEKPDPHQISVRVLDLCAGSGCIGVAILKAIPSARVDFVEIDSSHHRTIEKNINGNIRNPQRARIFGGNLYEHIADTYDYILSNPPYINSRLGRTDPSVLEHEPHLALFAEEGGLECIRKILFETHQYLKESGTLVIEHEPEHALEMDALGTSSGYTVETYTDQFGVNRYTFFTRLPVENVPR